VIVKVISSAVVGIESHRVDVEVYVSPGLPVFSIVGLPDIAVRESKDRTKAAIKNAGYRFPRHHVTVNLAPADIKKEGTGFDLPIAVGILAAEEILPGDRLANYSFTGELSLDGGIKGVQGVLPAALRARGDGLKGIVVPGDNAEEAAMIEGIDVIPVSSLPEIVEFFSGRMTIAPYRLDATAMFRNSARYETDYRDIRGQELAKRALEIAAAGGHNVLMIGPPGSGKTMLARRLPTILPPLSFEEAIETTKIFSVAGLLDKKSAILAARSFRSPHHTISDAGLIGGGQVPRPGEISLAHHGVLFLDELPEFKKNVLEALRQPLEEGAITITRSSQTATYPARFILVAAMNPCPCGYYGSKNRECRCTMKQIRQYQAKVSGPLMDRIDIHIEVPSVAYRDLAGKQAGDSSQVIAERIMKARAVQAGRFNGSSAINARMSDQDIKTFCAVDEEATALIEMALTKFGLTARAYTKILKVARTIADLEGYDAIHASHVAEAVQYRTLDRSVI